MTQASCAHGHTNICASIHKHVCSVAVAHARVYCISVCAHACKTMLTVSYSQAVETDLPQCVYCLVRGEEYRKDVALHSREICLPQRISGGKINKHTDVAVVRVHLLHGYCTNAEQLHKPRRNCERRAQSSYRAKAMWGLGRAASICKNSNNIFIS